MELVHFGTGNCLKKKKKKPKLQLSLTIWYKMIVLSCKNDGL